jgi:carbon storage regulator
MLMLTRRPGEDLIIYTDEGLMITIGVHSLHGGQVKLGIQAPQHVHVDRKEIYTRKQADKSRA